MKIDKLDLRIITGLIFVLIISILVFFMEPKESNNTDLKKQNYLEETNNINIVDQDLSMRDFTNEEENEGAKEEVFSLIYKNIQSFNDFEAFVYYKDENGNYQNVFIEGNYDNLVDYINLSEYRENEYEFSTLRNTNEYIWGAFYKSNAEQEEKTYIMVDKSNGLLKFLNNSSIQVVVYDN